MSLEEIFCTLMLLTTFSALLLGFPVALTLAGSGVLWGMVGVLFGIVDLDFFGALPSRIFGSTMINVILIAVPLFIFMGFILERSKVAEQLLETMGRLFGTIPGGIGISVTLVGALLAASTGIVGATVVTMGLLSLPTMLKNRYNPSLACGVICSAGTLGQIIPPSIVLILLGDQISNAYIDAQRSLGNFAPEPISIGDLFAGALLPGLLLVALYIAYQVILALVRPSLSPAVRDSALRPVTFTEICTAVLPAILLILAVLGAILFGFATSTEAAAVGAIGGLFLAALQVSPTKRTRRIVFAALAAFLVMIVLSRLFDMRIAKTVFSTEDAVALYCAAVLAAFVLGALLYAIRCVLRVGILKPVLERTVQVSTMVFVLLIGATMFSLAFRGLGGDEIVREFLFNLPGGFVSQLLVVMLLIFLLGFFLDFIEIIFVVIPLTAPVLLLSGVSPVWLGILIALNLQTSFLTPPFGFALFYLRGVAPASVRTLEIYRGVLPFVVLQLLALVMTGFFPFLTDFLPLVLFDSDYSGG